MLRGVPELLLQPGVEDDSGTVGVGPEVLEEGEECLAHPRVELPLEVGIAVTFVEVEVEELLEGNVVEGGVGTGARGAGGGFVVEEARLVVGYGRLLPG